MERLFKAIFGAITGALMSLVSIGIPIAIAMIVAAFFAIFMQKSLILGYQVFGMEYLLYPIIAVIYYILKFYSKLVI